MCMVVSKHTWQCVWWSLNTGVFQQRWSFALVWPLIMKTDTMHTFMSNSSLFFCIIYGNLIAMIVYVMMRRSTSYRRELLLFHVWLNSGSPHYFMCAIWCMWQGSMMWHFMDATKNTKSSKYDHYIKVCWCSCLQISVLCIVDEVTTHNCS